MRAACAMEDCARQVKGRGLCNLHYQRWRKENPGAAPLPSNAGRFQPGHKPTHLVKGKRNNTGRTHFQPGHKPWQDGTATLHTCEVCGVTFYRYGRTRANRFCSHRCRAISFSGAAHPQWKVGVTPENERARRTPGYRAWRAAVFARDDFTCQFCGERGGRLHADHIHAFATHPDLRLDIDNGRTLCVPCHKTTPTYGGRTRS